MVELVRCSEWSRATGLEPIATIGCYSGYLLIEWPLPWPSDMSEVPELSRLAAATRERNVRLQGLVQDRAAPTSHVIYYGPTEKSTGGPAAGREMVVASESVVDAALNLLSDGEGAQAVAPEICDVLICTHGSRDRCCGSLGTKLATRLLEGDLSTSRRVRLWRTSHTGGHRFAPTALILPEATGWAFVDEDLLRSVINRTGDLQTLINRYRGRSLLPDAESQVAEARAIQEAGWDAFSAKTTVSRGPDGATEVSFDMPDGRRYVAQAMVSVAGQTPLPTCGEPADLTTKTQRQWRVEDFHARTEATISVNL